ncbi:MAG: hypothetical protein AMXMBFR64_50310 [Myxococcales bacterium]
MDALRSCLRGTSFQTTTHSGLWLDKFLPAVKDDDASGQGDEGVKAQHIKKVQERTAPDGYKSSFERWRALWRNCPRALVVEAEVLGRMVVGLGAKGALEAGLRLDHTWGVPIVPGSALKGIAAAAAHLLADDDAWRKNLSDSPRTPKTAYDALFGTNDEEGAVAFHDAWWVPKGKVPIHLDVMTVHHKRYYESASAPPAPSDTDSPTPIPFASVSGAYLIVLEAEDEGWREAALELLRLGFEHLGAGAKTNAGYGRLRLPQRITVPGSPEPPARSDLERQMLRARIERLTRNEAEQAVGLLEGLTGQERVEIARAIVEKLDLAWITKKPRAWAPELLKAAELDPPKP